VPVVRDAVVVGGGPAGLAAATWLARYRRDVVLIDAGEPRAHAVEWSHGYLGADPQRPMELLARAREQLLGYPTASHLEGKVAAARHGDGHLVLTLDDGREIATLRVVLATGVVDAFPDLDGFFEHYGASAFHCPACDGFDAEDKDVVAYGWDERLVGFATSLLNWARSVTVLTGGRRFDGDDACVDVLTGHGVEMVESPAVRMLGSRGDLTGIELADGRVVPAEVLFFSVDHAPRTDLARQLGCDIDDEGYVAVDGNGRTSVDSVYAAGDATPGLQLVQVAAAQGTAAGIAAARSLHGTDGSPLSPRPAPDAPREVDAARP
jgi:thioredoxin reductase